MITLYFDESGQFDNPQDEWACLAAVAVHDETRPTLDRQIGDVRLRLNATGIPPLDSTVDFEFKGEWIWWGNQAFAPIKGDRNARERWFKSLGTIINNLGLEWVAIVGKRSSAEELRNIMLQRITKASAKVPLENWPNRHDKAKMSSGEELISTTDVMLMLLVQLCGNLFARHESPDRGVIVFDRSLTDRPDWISNWFEISNDYSFMRDLEVQMPEVNLAYLPPTWMREMTQEHVRFQDSHSEIGIQLADILAFACRNLMQRVGASRVLWDEVLRSPTIAKLKMSGHEVDGFVLTSTSYTREQRRRQQRSSGNFNRKNRS